MSKTVLLFSVILILALVGVIGCSSDDKESPEDVVISFLDAVQHKNIEKIASLTTEDYAEVVLDLENYEEQIEGISVKYSNISTDVLYQDEENATVNISYAYKFERVGEMDNIGYVTDTVTLTKVDDSWLIDGVTYESSDEMAYDISKDGTEEIPPEQFTEFYVLGPDGTVTSIPSQLKLHEEASVILGVVNHEGTQVHYDLEVTIDGNSTLFIGFYLDDEEKYEEQVPLVPQQIGPNQKVEFTLSKDIQDSITQNLVLWVDVNE